MEAEEAVTHPLIERAIATLGGSQSKLAEAIGVSQQQVSKLLRKDQGISAEVALAIHTATDGAVSKSELRPDLWPVPAAAA